MERKKDYRDYVVALPGMMSIGAGVGSGLDMIVEYIDNPGSEFLDYLASSGDGALEGAIAGAGIYGIYKVAEYGIGKYLENKE